MTAPPFQTQENTQRILDPRRTGNDSSDLDAADIADVICILHPASDAALEIAARTAKRQPKHVHQFNELNRHEVNSQRTFILPESEGRAAFDLALRFSSPVKTIVHGFVFGRNEKQCDILLDTDAIRRISAVHFRIYINRQGVLMLHDTSTNGTLVDDVVLRGKTALGAAQTRMLKSGSVIQILSQKPEELIKFIVRIPQRFPYEQDFDDNFRSYINDVAIAEALLAAQARDVHNKQVQVAQRLQQLPSVPGKTSVFPSIRHQSTRNEWGMYWNGGNKYNIVGHVGQGAFAKVYKVATKVDGVVYAAKELEKRRFVKNGVLDRKLDNEMQIMKDLCHPHIVQYVEYHDHDKHLYIIMEYVAYGDLQQYLSNNGPLPEHMGRLMAVQVLQALSYLHVKRITHRDIKPDNILIADADPDNFWVKLSDFGLSKVVKDNDTFLKTFCGTLLYCAPEVFPHYDAHVAQHGGLKRQRRTAGNQKTYHSYSQSVDVWSFGAVLWFALCGKTPFEGVMDSTGRGMFDRIMQTPLNTFPLMQHGVSGEAINLLGFMLRTNPAERPTPSDCLHHPWFAGMALEGNDIDDDSELDAIDEEEEELEDPTRREADEPDLSQLRIDEGSLGYRGEVSMDSSDLDFLDPRESKRLKQQLSHSPLSSSHRASSGSKFDASSQAQPRRQLLFGEVTGSMLNQRASQRHGQDASDESERRDTSAGSTEVVTDLHGKNGGRVASDVARPDSFALSHHVAGNSLSGAELMVRDLKMDSLRSRKSANGEANEPRTPDPSQHAPKGDGKSPEETPTKAQETTPRPAPLGRHIQPSLTAAYFYDPHDASTHNPEYASLLSGHDFLKNPIAPASFDSFAHFSALASAKHGDVTQDVVIEDRRGSARSQQSRTEDESRDIPSKIAAQAEDVHRGDTPADDSQFAPPKPRLGRLVSTPDSFDEVEFKLEGSLTTWGRAPENTYVYGDKNDTRIPKQAIVINFNAPGLPEAMAAKQDWTKLPGLNSFICTSSGYGIWVNGTKLAKMNDKGRKLFGRLHHGDVIKVVQGRRAKNGQKGTELAFKVEIFHGSGSKPREKGDEFRVEVDRSRSMKE